MIRSIFDSIRSIFDENLAHKSSSIAETIRRSMANQTF
jgi:hypothetical protein